VVVERSVLTEIKEDVCLFCHVLNDNLNDDDDDDDDDDISLSREIKCMFVRTRFSHFCKPVKLVLFRSFCLCMYNVALWKYYSATAFR